MVHPRMDFAILAADQIVNQAAKWRHMLGNQGSPNVTFRTIINRGGEQGAQHSQALHSWFAHIPGLRVLMPSNAQDARDMLIAASMSQDPVLYIDDRWCYDETMELGAVINTEIETFTPSVRKCGTDVTVVASGYSTVQASRVADRLKQVSGISCEVIDIRQINPLDYSEIIKSINKTGLLCVVDGGWSNCGLAGEIIALAVENINPQAFKKCPVRLTLTASPAPSAANLEKAYYTTDEDIEEAIVRLVTT